VNAAYIGIFSVGQHAYNNSELGYAVTDHTAQGRTVHTGLAVITGTEDRQHAYVALTRGTDANHAYVFTLSPNRADPVPGPRPAPELTPYDRLYPERSGGPAPATPPALPGNALTVLAAVLHHDGQQLTAAQTRNQALADADHLAVLHAIWNAETTPARHRHYQDLLQAALSPGHRTEPGHHATWLWRTLRAAELAGQDPAQLLADVIAERDLDGARDIPAVLDARLRRRLGSMIPLPTGPWSSQVPVIADPERSAYLTQIAALMDARKDRLGEHAAEHAPPWAVNALGPVPAEPAERRDWQQRASSIGAYRELSGHDHSADPIGPEPATAAPEIRAVWHEALAALGPADGPDVRGMPDGRLLHLRDTYPIETAWAPRYVGDELRQVRAAAWDAHLAGLRATAEAGAARQRGDHDTVTSKHELAASYQALQDVYRQRETIFAATMADRDDWDAATRAQRHLAIAADTELRRRHPGQPFPPLRSAEPEPATENQRTEPAPTLREPPDEMGKLTADFAAAHRRFTERLANRQSLTIPSPDPGYGDLGQAFPPWPRPGRDAILQPPKPEIQPNPHVLERAADRDADWEAGD
jgi:hypothetical protein